MRVLRAKSVRKHLKFYNLIFGITGSPYHIILDGNFIFTALKLKLDIRDRLVKLLQGHEVKLYILKSIVKELEIVGVKAKPAKEFAEAFCEVIDDGTMQGPTGADRLRTFFDNINSDKVKVRRYLLATQDQELRRSICNIPGIPLIYLNKVTLLLEAPSLSSLRYNQQIEEDKSMLNVEEQSVIKSLSSKRKASHLDEGTVSSITHGPSINAATTSISSSPSQGGPSIVAPRRKHIAKAPNPLSSLQPKEDSKNTVKKKEKKFRKFY